MEAKMNNMQMRMDPYTHNAFWLEDRITVTFQLGPDIATIPVDGREAGGHAADEGVASQEERPRLIPAPTFDKASAIPALMINELNDFLAQNQYPTLHPIDFTDTLRAPGGIPPADLQQVG